MEISKDQFPIVVQAFEITNNKEFFVAEQVVNSQAEVETFSTRYAGKVLKARALNSNEVNQQQHRTVYSRPRRSNAGAILLAILIILILLVAIGYYTGWIQKTFGIGT